jgi:hypothetical protein
LRASWNFLTSHPLNACIYIYIKAMPHLQFPATIYMYLHPYRQEIQATKEIEKMNHLGPSYLLPEILIGTVAVIATILIGIYRALSRAEFEALDRKSGFWSISALLVAWSFTALALSWSGFYQGTTSRIPTIPFGLLIPIAAGVVLFWRWPLLRRIIESVPRSWIVSVQAYRIEGLIFLTLYAGGWLPGAFAWPAGVGDVIVGLLAPVVGVAYMRGVRGSTGLLWAWNLLGIADLVVAVTTGFLTSPSPLQLLALDRPNELISSFPLTVIPVFLVPLAALLHLASLQKLRQVEREAGDLSPVQTRRKSAAEIESANSDGRERSTELPGKI